jgi:hypothetical protein
LSEPIPRLPVQLVQHVAGHRHVTTFAPEKAIASMKVRGFALVGWTAGGTPIFEGLSTPWVEEVLSYLELGDMVEAGPKPEIVSPP